jgi:hypothetical protein
MLHSPDALASDAHVNRAVAAAKAAVQSAVAETAAEVIHLFLATPAHFALFLGHRLNATARVVCHERSDCGYVPTCTVWGGP